MKSSGPSKPCGTGQACPAQTAPTAGRANSNVPDHCGHGVYPARPKTGVPCHMPSAIWPPRFDRIRHRCQCFRLLKQGGHRAFLVRRRRTTVVRSASDLALRGIKPSRRAPRGLVALHWPRCDRPRARTCPATPTASGRLHRISAPPPAGSAPPRTISSPVDSTPTRNMFMNQHRDAVAVAANKAISAAVIRRPCGKRSPRLPVTSFGLLLRVVSALLDRSIDRSVSPTIVTSSCSTTYDTWRAERAPVQHTYRITGGQSPRRIPAAARLFGQRQRMAAPAARPPRTRNRLLRVFGSGRVSHAAQHVGSSNRAPTHRKAQLSAGKHPDAGRARSCSSALHGRQCRPAAGKKTIMRRGGVCCEQGSTPAQIHPSSGPHDQAPATRFSSGQSRTCRAKFLHLGHASLIISCGARTAWFELTPELSNKRKPGAFRASGNARPRRARAKRALQARKDRADPMTPRAEQPPAPRKCQQVKLPLGLHSSCHVSAGICINRPWLRGSSRDVTSFGRPLPQNGPQTVAQTQI